MIEPNEYFRKQFAHLPTREMFDTIYRIAKESNYKEACEIGVAWAISTLAILSAGIGHLTSIDRSWYPNTVNQVAEYGYVDRWTYLQYNSAYYLKRVNPEKKFDLICIDGSHKYDDVLADLVYAVDRLKKDGIMIVDDIDHPKNFIEDLDEAYGVRQATMEIVEKYKFKITIYKAANGIAVLKK